MHQGVSDNQTAFLLQILDDSWVRFLTCVSAIESTSVEVWQASRNLPLRACPDSPEPLR